MRIAFMGASELGWACCNTLLKMGQDVVGIFSIPQTFRISWSDRPVKNVRFKSFEDLACARGVPLVYVTKKMGHPEYREALRQMRPDLIVVIDWYYMVPRALRRLAPLGTVGMHASLLPRYRGGAPLVWAMINGEQETGISFFYFEDGVDEGDIIAQARFDIAFEDTIADLVRKSSSAALGLLREYVPLLAGGKAPRHPQEHGRATLMPQRTPEDGLIDWQALSALQAYNWVRAQTRPYPGAFTYLDGRKVTLWKASPSPDTGPGNLSPGTVVERLNAPETFGVVCAGGSILNIHELEFAGGAPVSAAAALKERRISPGACFSAGPETDLAKTA